MDIGISAYIYVYICIYIHIEYIFVLSLGSVPPCAFHPWRCRRHEERVSEWGTYDDDCIPPRVGLYTILPLQIALTQNEGRGRGLLSAVIVLYYRNSVGIAGGGGTKMMMGSFTKALKWTNILSRPTRETLLHTRTARAQPPAAHRRRHSRPRHRRHGEHSPTARQPHSNGLCSPPKEGPGRGSALLSIYLYGYRYICVYIYTYICFITGAFIVFHLAHFTIGAVIAMKTERLQEVPIYLSTICMDIGIYASIYKHICFITGVFIPPCALHHWRSRRH